MAAIGTLIRLLALVVMYFISNPTILSLKTPEEAETLRMRVFDQKWHNYGKNSKAANPATATDGQQEMRNI